jgi:hypothetical protein
MNHKDLPFNDNPVKAVVDQQTVTGAEKGSCDRFFPSGMDGVVPPARTPLRAWWAKALAFLCSLVHLLGGDQYSGFDIGLACPVPCK